MGMGFAATWLRQVTPPLLHKTTLTTAEGFPLELYSVQRRFSSAKQTQTMGLPGRKKVLMISLAVWIQYTSVTDR